MFNPESFEDRSYHALFDYLLSALTTQKKLTPQLFKGMYVLDSAMENVIKWERLLIEEGNLLPPE